MFKTHSSSIHNLEVQIGQIANALTSRNQGNLPSNAETNPREQVKAISLRSGKNLAQPKETISNKPAKTKIDDSSEEAVYKKKSQSKENNTRVYKPPIPFPQRLKKQEYDPQFSKFLDMLKKI